MRPHPKLGTVETRVFDQQTRLEDTLGLAALTLSLAHRLSQLFDDGEPLVEVPTSSSTTTRSAPRCAGSRAQLVDFPQARQRPAPEMVRHLLDELGGAPSELGCAGELAGDRGSDRTNGTGARRQLDCPRT